MIVVVTGTDLKQDRISFPAPDITVQCLVILSCILEIPFPNFSLETSHPDEIFAVSPSSSWQILW
jgi:hypothetical protein